MTPGRRAARAAVIVAVVAAGVALLAGAAFLVSDPEKLDLDSAVLRTQPGGAVALSDGAVYYEWAGPARGPVVVMVNPFSVPLYVWERNVDTLVSRGIRVLRYDLYGRGFSARPRVTYDTALFVRQLEGLIGALAIPTPVALAGVSMGAGIAATFTALHPDLVERLCLVDPPVRDVTGRTTFPMNVPGIGELLMAVYVIPSVLSSPAGDFYRPGSVPDWSERFAGQTRFKGFRRALLSTLRNLPRSYRESYARVGELGKPVLLVWGEKDNTQPIAGAGRIRAVIPQAEFHAIPDAGHLSHYERADLVNPILAAVLAAARGPWSL